MLGSWVYLGGKAADIGYVRCWTFLQSTSLVAPPWRLVPDAEFPGLRTGMLASPAGIRAEGSLTELGVPAAPAFVSPVMGTMEKPPLAYADSVNFCCDASAASEVCVGRITSGPFFFPPTTRRSQAQRGFAVEARARRGASGTGNLQTPIAGRDAQHDRPEACATYHLFSRACRRSRRQRFIRVSAGQRA